MVDHVIVIGLGAVGISVVRGLVAEGESVVVIERDSDNRYRARLVRLVFQSLPTPRSRRRTTWSTSPTPKRSPC